MSEERRPPVPAPGAPPAATADTPREGTPAFGDTEEVEVVFDKDTVPPVGPTPDYASEYVPPRPLPKPAEHKTIENIPVKIAPEADPRRAMTQKAMHVLKREEAQRHLMLMGVDATAATPSARPSEASISDAEGAGKSRAGLYIGGAMVLLIVLALGFIAVRMVMGDPVATDAASSSAAPAPAPAPTRNPGTTLAPTAPAPPPSPAPLPPTTGESEPKLPTTRKPKPVGPKPINE